MPAFMQNAAARLKQVRYALTDIAGTLELHKLAPVGDPYVVKLCRERDRLLDEQAKLSRTARLATPSIHVDGTCAETLRDEFAEADRALETAIMAVRKAAPRVRDYRPQGDTEFATARRQHGERLAALEKIRAEFAIVARSIDAQ